VRAEARPAFYALERGSWRDYVTLLHVPYTAWHLSYVAIGCALAPTLHTERLLAALAAFFLALGIAAHALDELRGRPLGTSIPNRVLIGLAALPLLGAVAIGVVSAIAWTPWLLAFVALGAFLVPAYNLELFGGRFHSHLWFGLAWGAFPVLTGYVVTAERVDPEAVLAAVAALFLSLAQRHLSTQVRTVRRRVELVEGTIAYRDGSTGKISTATLLGAPELALRALTLATVAFAAALVATHV
jgi:heme O synthase-like polyprenyltransferase